MYRGFSNTENWVLNLAGFSAVVAALVPMETPLYCGNCGSNTFSIVHEGAGIVLFFCMAFVAWACVDETLVQCDGVPIAVGLGLIVSGDLEREGFVMFERGPPLRPIQETPATLNSTVNTSPFLPDG